jgi:hypothetical protein
LGANFENSEILAPILKIFGAKDENASFFSPNLKIRHFWRQILNGGIFLAPNFENIAFFGAKFENAAFLAPNRKIRHF